jgi:hypothetical protein
MVGASDALDPVPGVDEPEQAASMGRSSKAIPARERMRGR